MCLQLVQILAVGLEKLHLSRIILNSTKSTDKVAIEFKQLRAISADRYLPGLYGWITPNLESISLRGTYPKDDEAMNWILAQKNTTKLKLPDCSFHYDLIQGGVTVISLSSKLR